MSEDTLEKKHQATGKRLADLRKKGQTMRSHDMVSGLIIIACVMIINYMSPLFKQQFEKNFLIAFYNMKSISNDADMFHHILRSLVFDNFIILLPLFIVLFVVTLFSPFIFGGWNFTLEPLQLKWDKLNPANNLKNIFSKRIFIEIIRSIVKVVIVAFALGLFIVNKQNEINHLTSLPLMSSLHFSYDITNHFVSMIIFAIVIIALFDVGYHYFEYQNKAKMTSQEIKDESKDTDGNPEIKRRQRSAQYMLLKQRISLAVPKASVIITNPTHYAIALRYDSRKDTAPIVVAKGKDYIAQQIRMLAISNGVPIYEAPLLARALYRTANVGNQVHASLYMAVAIVLSYVHQLKNYQQGIGQIPQYVSDLNIPEEFIYHD